MLLFQLVPILLLSFIHLSTTSQGDEDQQIGQVPVKESPPHALNDVTVEWLDFARNKGCKGKGCSTRRDGGNIDRDKYYKRMESSSESDESDGCSLKRDFGDCNNRRRRYYFHSPSGRCRTFTYSGCGGNSNNFYTRSHCQQECGGSRRRRFRREADDEENEEEAPEERQSESEASYNSPEKKDDNEENYYKKAGRVRSSQETNDDWEYYVRNKAGRVRSSSEWQNGDQWEEKVRNKAGKVRSSQEFGEGDQWEEKVRNSGGGKGHWGKGHGNRKGKKKNSGEDLQKHKQLNFVYVWKGKKTERG